MTQNSALSEEATRLADVFDRRRMMIAAIGFLILIVGSLYASAFSEVTHIQAITLRMVSGLSAAGLAAAAIVLANLISLGTAFTKAILVAGIVGAGAASYVGLPVHERSSAVQNHSAPEGFIASPPPGSIILAPLPSGREIEGPIAAPKNKPSSEYGYYYESIMPQGDSDENHRKIIRKACVPGRDMPEVCYLPKANRENLLIIRP